MLLIELLPEIMFFYLKKNLNLDLILQAIGLYLNLHEKTYL